MMFIDRNPIPTQGFAVFQFIEKTVVELMTLHRIKECVGQLHPDGVIGARFLQIEIGIGHQVKENEFKTLGPIWTKAAALDTQIEGATAELSRAEATQEKIIAAATTGKKSA